MDPHESLNLGCQLRPGKHLASAGLLTSFVLCAAYGASVLSCAKQPRCGDGVVDVGEIDADCAPSYRCRVGVEPEFCTCVL